MLHGRMLYPRGYPDKVRPPCPDTPGGNVAGEVSVGESRTGEAGVGEPGAVVAGAHRAPAIRAVGLGRTFDTRPALEAVDLEVVAGEVVAVLGPSGCGKTTLLSLLAGLLAPTTGTIEVGVAPVAYVFQEPALMPWRNVADNAGVLAEVGGVPEPERRRRVAETLKLVGLDDVAHALPHTLSGGMQMRASLARALVTEPALLLADEPFGALDEITRSRLDIELASLARRQGITTVMVTHSIDEAVLVADRVVVLGGRPGRVVADVAVPLGSDRTTHTRFDPQATELTAHLLELLEAAP